MAQQSKGRVLCPRCDSPIWPFQRPPRLLTPAPLAPSLLGLQACSTVMSVAYCFLMDFATVPAHFHNGKKRVFSSVDSFIPQWNKNHSLSGGILRNALEFGLLFVSI